MQCGPGGLSGLIELPGGEFTMGTDGPWRWPADGEGPARRVRVDGFALSPTTVTNTEFAAFVEATDYRSEAEVFGWSFVFGGFLPDDFPETRGVVNAEWWRQVFEATWRQPAGPQSNLDGLEDHPVTHISHNDALAYCRWVGGRLPTEAEWEYAARGGLDAKRYSWGDDFAPDGQTMCNIFEGSFPDNNTTADGFAGTAPSESFPPNGFGMCNMAGNVWEWCADWFDPGVHAAATDRVAVNPTGPTQGQARVMRGGSYLCHDSYCDRYRVAARSSNTADSTTGNLGFRVAADLASQSDDSR